MNWKEADAPLRSRASVLNVASRGPGALGRSVHLSLRVHFLQGGRPFPWQPPAAAVRSKDCLEEAPLGGNQLQYPQHDRRQLP